jgi:hypothetical protein
VACSATISFCTIAGLFVRMMKMEEPPRQKKKQEKHPLYPGWKEFGG